jgi:hypothetical protein
VLVAQDEAGALQEDRGDPFLTTSVENKDPIYLSSGGATPRRVRGCANRRVTLLHMTTPGGLCNPSDFPLIHRLLAYWRKP